MASPAVDFWQNGLLLLLAEANLRCLMLLQARAEHL